MRQQCSHSFGRKGDGTRKEEEGSLIGFSAFAFFLRCRTNTDS